MKMITSEMFWIGMAAILSQIGHVTSHGRLIQPAQRSSAWRFGYNNPKNYNDNELFCGGFAVQWNSENQGRCGACGDEFSATVKPNEDADGKYVTNGVITGNYVKGDVITAKVQITAYHLGWFEFRLCPLETPSTVVTQECLNKILLTVAGSSTTRIVLEDIKTGTGVETFQIDLQLPDNITCERCVLQWKYNTGNSWGCDSTTCAVGLGPQENFVNCADIKIDDGHITTTSPTTTNSSTASQSATMSVLTSSTMSSKSSTSISASTSQPTSSSPSTSDSASSSTSSSTTLPASTSSPTTSSSTTSSTSTSSPTTSTITTSLETSTLSTTTTSLPTSSETTTTSTTTVQESTAGSTVLQCSDSLACEAVGAYSNNPGMPQWCCNNCVLGYCPPSHCSCF